MAIHRLDINCDWKFRQQNKAEWLPAKVPGCVHTDLLDNRIIEDPFYRTNERQLQWIDKLNWEYQTQFTVSTEILNMKRHRLVLEGLDTYAEVYLNGKKLLQTDNMFRCWKVEVDDTLQQTNELRIAFRSPVIEDVPKYNALEYHLPAVNDQSDVGELGEKRISIFARKAPYHYGWDWGPRFVTMGIWRPVYLLGWNDAIIESIHFKQNNVSDKKAEIETVFEISSEKKQTLRLKLTEKNDNTIYIDKSIQLKPGCQLINFPIEIKNPRLWWCSGLGEPYLYLFNTELYGGHTKIDEKAIRVGIRSLKVIREKDKIGRSFYFELNGIPVFAKGANYIPNDNFITRVPHSHYDHIIRSAVDAHMNMLRVWGGGIYEYDIFYELCDHHGILVWHDFMFACSMYPGDKNFFDTVQHEIVDNVKRLRNHACIALWCGNNENDMIWNLPNESGWKKQFDPKTADKIWADYRKLFYDMIPSILKEVDPKRFYWPSSPLAEYDERASYTTKSGDMHYWGVWHSKEPFEKYKEHPARFMSEYGFQSFPELASVKPFALPEDWDIDSEVMAAHQRSGIGNQRIKMYMERDYHLPDNFDHMLYMSQVLQAEGIKIGMEAHRRGKPYCMGSLFWQINDCWPAASWSSIDYHGRWKALHYFAKKAFAPVLISPDLTEEVINVSLISDLPEPVNCRIELQLMDFTGRILWESELKITLDANDNRIIFETRLKDLTGSNEINRIMLYCGCYENDLHLSENILYFERIKNLELPKPEISFEIAEIPSGYRLNLSSNTLVKNLYLSSKNHNVFFADNYFDLLPGKPVHITCISHSRIKQFAQKLKMVSVYDTYH